MVWELDKIQDSEHRVNIDKPKRWNYLANHLEKCQVYYISVLQVSKLFMESAYDPSITLIKFILNSYDYIKNLPIYEKIRLIWKISDSSNLENLRKTGCQSVCDAHHWIKLQDLYRSLKRKV